MGSTFMDGKILLKPVEEEKQEDNYGYEEYPFEKPTVYLHGAVETYYPQTIFSWSDDSVLVVRENRVVKYTRSTFTELLAKDEKGDIVWMDGRCAPYSNCWKGEYLDEYRGGEEFTIKTYDLKTMKKQSFKAVLQKEEDMDDGDVMLLSGYVETKDLEEKFKVKNGMLVECNAREEHITLPDSVTSIGWSSFYGRENTKSITLPKTLNNISGSPFSHCTSLERVYVDKDNPKYYSINGSLVDRSTKTLIWASSDFEIPSDGSVERIGEEAYNGRGITNIKIPNSVVAIENGAFMNCKSLVSVDIPSSVTEIASDVFCRCKSLKSVTIQGPIKALNTGCFFECHSLESVTLPSSLTGIGFNVFSDCKSLKNIEIPSSVTEIGNSAFQECYSLTEIKIPASVTVICDYAFNGCKNLVSVELPNGLRKLGKSIFSGCKALANIKIPSSVLEIGSGCFTHCESLAEFDMPDSVVEVGEYAFHSCESLTKLKLSSSLFKIPNNMCVFCRKLDNVVIPTSVCKIGESAFMGCSALANIEIPDTVKIIDDSAFNGCKFTSNGEEESSSDFSLF